ncbi:MAG: hypothetical protein JW841_15030 [Deltaproteobacteria bacterium]|nr:hypothetical protein [Deltaproteobacteria bacterium]
MTIKSFHDAKNITNDVPELLIDHLKRGPNGLFLSDASLLELKGQLQVIKTDEILFAIANELLVFSGVLLKQQNSVYAANQVFDLFVAVATTLGKMAQSNIAAKEKVDRLHAMATAQRNIFDKKPATFDALQTITASGFGIRNQNK